VEEEKGREMLLPVIGGGSQLEEEQREKEEEKKHLDAAAAGGKEKGWAPGKRNRGEGGMEFPKDLCAKSENCRDLFVKQNFPSI
jgi:hypothetical protein